MESMRPSILRRPMRATNCTHESAEEQFRREQETIAARSRRMMATEERLMGALYPTAEGQQQRMHDLERTRQEQLAAQAAERRREEELVSAFSGARPSTAPPPPRPWEGASLSYATRCEEDCARRELQARVADDNRRMAVEKALQQQAQKQADAAAVREQLQQPQASFWNVGSVPGSGRYIASQARWGMAAAAPAAGYAGVIGSYSGPTAAAPAAAGTWAEQQQQLATGGCSAVQPEQQQQQQAESTHGLRAPWATTSSAGTATAAGLNEAVRGVKPSGVQPPWATHTNSPNSYTTNSGMSYSVPAAPPAATAAGSLSSSDGDRSSSVAVARQFSSGGGGFGGGGFGRKNIFSSSISSNNAAGVAGVFGGGAEQQKHQSVRPQTAAAGSTRYPWEWPGA